MINAYCTGHKWSVMVCQAFAKGAKCPIVPPAPLLPGDVFMYGALRGLLPTLRQAQREGRTWLYADNGYFLPGKKENSYYRITKNALQHDGGGEWSKNEALARWRQLRVPIKPWRKGGKHIVICPPGRLFAATFGFDADEWLDSTVKTLRECTDRELRIREKMSWNDVKPVYPMYVMDNTTRAAPGSLAEDLIGAWALVTRSSNSAVEALTAGVPVFCTDTCGASALALSDLRQIESPRMDGNREKWAAILASNQWSLKEIREGIAWKMLNEAARGLPNPAQAGEVSGNVFAALGS